MTLVRADGTALAKAPGATVLETQPEADPRVEVLIDVYKTTPYDGAAYPTQMRQVAFRAGTVIPLSRWNAEFTPPTVSAVSPDDGPAAGGTAITITGQGFSPDATVTVGGTAATAVTVRNGTTITATTPAGTAGAKNVVVTTSGGAGTKTAGFTYT